jgi:hypothetical protein
MGQREHSLMQVMLRRHEDALAVEQEVIVGAPQRPDGGVLQLQEETTHLLERACSAAASAPVLVSRRDRASATMLRSPGRYSIAKSILNSLLIHGC